MLNDLLCIRCGRLTATKTIMTWERGRPPSGGIAPTMLTAHEACPDLTIDAHITCTALPASG